MSIWTILAIPVGLASFFLAYMVYSNYGLNEASAKISEGVLSKDAELQYSRDYYSTKERVVGLRLYLEKSKEVLIIPGKLLDKMPPAVASLKKEERIQFTTVEPLKLNKLRTIISLKLGEKDFLTKAEALAFYKSPKYLYMSISFFLIGSLLLIWVLKNLFWS